MTAILGAAMIVAPMVYIVFFWTPCICSWLRQGETCPRHGVKQ